MKQIIRCFATVMLASIVIATTMRVSAAPTSSPVFSVASGDAAQTSIILWAHSQNLGEVTFDYATSSDFTTILGTSKATITDPTIPVKVELGGLKPGTRYYYRVTDAAHQQATGTFKLPAEKGQHPGLKFGVSGDWQGGLVPYPAISNVATRQLDFFVMHGDTIYSDVPSPDIPAVRSTTLAEYRAKYNESLAKRYAVSAWVDARSSTQMYATIDDHEVGNDFSGGAAPSSDNRFDNTGKFINETNLYKIGLQAFQEYMPIRPETYGETGDPRTAGKTRLYRFRTFGSDAAIFVLDERSFRDPELENVPFNQITNPAQVKAYQTKSYTPGRTMLGAAQLAQLKSDLLQAQNDGVTWKFILNPEPIQNLGILNASDRYEGYAAERAELLNFIQTKAIENVVFITADFHVMMVNNLLYQKTVDGTPIRTRTWEIITGPVAVDPPFGPSVVQLGVNSKMLSPAAKNLYDALPMPAKDNLVETMLDAQLGLYHYDPVGLDKSGISATLVKGGYIAAHVYGWTEFDIDPRTETLTVTTYGIPWYSQAQLHADPSKITALVPQVVSQFTVKASLLQ